MFRKITTTGILLFAAAAAFAQSGSINGKIISRDGTPVIGVNVSINGTTKGAVTEEDGSYSIKNIKAGEYILTANLIGLQKQMHTVVVKDGEVNTVNFSLTEDSKTLNEVMVKAIKSYNREVVTIGKLPIKAMDMPQSIAVVNHEILEQQQTTHLSDVLKNVNGVYQMGSTGGVQEEVAARGFAFGSSNTFKNGVRYNSGINPEISSLERVEVLKGSAAILYGNVAAGGVLNLVTKKPKFEKGGEVTMRMGSYDFYKPSFDVYGPINNSNAVAFRLNGSYEKSRSFRDNVKGERFYINPSFLINAGKKIDVLIEGDYLRDDRTLDYGVGAINYKLIDVPRSRFLGATWSYNKVEQMGMTVTTTYHINNNWEVRNVSGAQNYTADLFGTMRPNASSVFVAADGKWVRGVQRTGTYEEYYMTELDLTGRFRTGNIKHTLLIGADIDKYLTSATAYNPVAKYDSVNVFDLDKYKQRTDIPTLTQNTLTQSPIRRVGAYVQDLVDVTSKIKLLAGLRYSYLSTEAEVLTYAKNTTTKATNFDNAFTPRVGIVYQPMKTMSVFASYATSFVPNTGAANLDISGNPLQPSIYTQYEAGVKNELFKGLLTANLTAYQIVNSNLVQSVLDSLYPNAKEMGGEVTSRGLEVDVMTKSYNSFTVVAGYSYNKTTYTKSNTYEVGSMLRYNPNHTANASIYYAISNKSVLKGLNFGLSALYFGERFAGRSTRYLLNGKELKNDTYKLMELPAFTQIDASIGYQLYNVSLRFRVTNVFDILNYHVHDDNSVNPIAPRQVVATLLYKF